MTDLPETTRTRFRIAPGDVGRYVRRKSTGDVGRVQRDPGNGWLHPHPLKYEWEIERRWRRKCGGSGACRWWVARFLGASEGQCSGIALAPEVDLASALRNARGAQLAAAPPCSACRLGDIG